MRLIKFGTKEIKTEKFTPIKNRPLGWVKPTGGIWASTLLPLEENLSAWADWCISEDYHVNELREICIFSLKETARIATIDSFNDLIELHSKYPCKGILEDKYLDFEKLSHDYDVIHLTENGQMATRLTSLNLYRWDCESFLIMNPNVIYDLVGMTLPTKWWQKEIKTLCTYYKSDANTWSEYAKPGDFVSDDVIDYFTDILPPVTQTKYILQAGGACDHKENPSNEKIEATYLTFVKLAPNFNIYIGELFRM